MNDIKIGNNTYIFETNRLYNDYKRYATKFLTDELEIEFLFLLEFELENNIITRKILDKVSDDFIKTHNFDDVDKVKVNFFEQYKYSTTITITVLSIFLIFWLISALSIKCKQHNKKIKNKTKVSKEYIRGYNDGKTYQIEQNRLDKINEEYERP